MKGRIGNGINMTFLAANREGKSCGGLRAKVRLLRTVEAAEPLEEGIE
jgi:hypothetical protein